MIVKIIIEENMYVVYMGTREITKQHSLEKAVAKLGKYLKGQK